MQYVAVSIHLCVEQNVWLLKSQWVIVLKAMKGGSFEFENKRGGRTWWGKGDNGGQN